MDNLIDGLKKGNLEAYQTLVKLYYNRLYKFISNVVRTDIADDLVQEVFLKILKNIKNYKPSDSIAPWLFKIARNISIDYLRKSQKDKQCCVENSIDIESGNYINPHHQKRFGVGVNPIDEIITKELKQSLLKAVRNLPFEQREVFLLREEGGLSFKDIADITGCSINTVLGRMHYALKNLRKVLRTNVYEV